MVHRSYRRISSVTGGGCNGRVVQDFMRLWLLRILVPLEGYKKFVRKDGFDCDVLAVALGLQGVGEEVGDFDQRAACVQLKKLYSEVENAAGRAVIPPSSFGNVGKLAELAGLSSTDQAILTFAALLSTDFLLDEAIGTLGNITMSDAYRIVSIVLDLPERDVQVALSSKGVLANTGIITRNVYSSRPGDLRDCLEIFSSSFADALLNSEADPIALLSDIVVPSQPPSLRFEDFSHVEHFLKVLRPYLLHSLDTRRTGVNVLLHGAPGTGKSELSRLLAQDLGGELFEVASEDDDGNPTGGRRRLNVFRAAQCFFANRRTILLFDEIDEIFEGGRHSMGKGNMMTTEYTPKAWINRMLEHNKVPTIWVANSVNSLDPAHIRRFDMVIGMPVPPLRQRERIIRQSGCGLLPSDSVARLAKHERVAPALVSRAVSVVRSISEKIGENAVPDTVEDLINSTLEAQKHKPLLKRNASDQLPMLYEPAFVNVGTDLILVADGLAKTRAGRLCLYGPPGTGKTAFGGWLSEKLGIPLHAKRGSDLFSKWVGGTEANIAKAFQEAEQDGALLVIDEVDSFLQDRRRAQRTWEVTEVNEMLTQMESFSGIFIATTNLMEGIDQAALRRFDLKLKFNYLKTEQAWGLFVRHCEAWSLSAPSEKLRSSVAKLTLLTPGDFATVRRRHQFSPIPTPKALLTVLGEECHAKEGWHGMAIGF